MTRKTRELLKRIETWPKADQDELVEVAVDIESRRTKTYRLSADEREALDRSQLDIDAGRFATDERMQSIFRRAGFHD